MSNYNTSKISLLDSPTRVMTPFVKVTIGDYTFGVFQHSTKSEKDSNGVYVSHYFQYPNYVQSLQVTKINGQVNQYSLVIKYPITQDSDPNFFEKVFSSVSQSRKIVFTYGDLSAPTMLYKNEEAMITNVQNTFDINSAVIQYSVSAVSSCKLATAGAFNFVSSDFTGKHQPSAIIKKLLKLNNKYGLQDIFTGMRNMNLVEAKGLIASDDVIVNLEAKTNISILDYVKYLVSCMKRSYSNTLYTMLVVDDTSDVFGGPYFKVINTTTSQDTLDTYVLDIGYPSNVLVESFNINNNEGYSILYDYSKELNTSEYVTRINDSGVSEQIYSPNITSNNAAQITHSNDYNWWQNVTAYPIKAIIKIKGVLRPAVLMSKLRLNVLFYGKAHTSSGTYIINKQVDNIDESGCWTTLDLVRTEGDTANFQSIV